ncbi:hypothetical protein Cme02nite_12020 [Catellatospora methionotrophica]|uniref:Uncharacterized protein n=1 Tax=Catellatospora methionotrophica TaxID=121620 RepID=A0A8J3LHU0_9ACTN|nr:hypothetical protein [Catellatospora methionotrophica]GIG12870.1 hypothetical protein Cme02nite_12020 [Catellatospora methionotrophica]
MLSGRGLVALTLLITLVGGCTAAAPSPAPETVLRPSWRELTLPAPPGPPGRLVLRDATVCAGRWYLSGALADPAGVTRPVVWTSADSESWRTLDFLGTTYYGERAAIYALGCRGDRIAMLGARSGGAHGNPRITQWYGGPDGPLHEVIAGFQLFGGPDAVNVARLAGGAKGWAIAGNRLAGAAVWTSPDATGFVIREGLPELARDGRGETMAYDVVATADGWLMVGALSPADRLDRDALAWASPDGVHWTRLPAPATGEYEQFDRVALVGGVPYAVGLRGARFGAWRLVDGGWADAGVFGSTRPGPVAWVAGLAVTDGGPMAVVSDGGMYRLWLMSPDQGWVAVASPAPMSAAGVSAAGVAGAGRRVLVIGDDGAGAHVWIMDLPAKHR